jgi:hypothetical protein
MASTSSGLSPRVSVRNTRRFALSTTFIGLTEEEVDANMEPVSLVWVNSCRWIVSRFVELSRECAEMTAAYSWSRSGVAPLLLC